MKITDIKQQQKQRARYSIYVDGKYAFSLSDWQLPQLNIIIGQEISKQELDERKKESTNGKLFDRTLMWLALRPRSEWEIDEYLKRKTKDQDSIKAIKVKVQDLNQINDLEFARSWVSSRRALKQTSRYRLSQELRQKRVSNEIIDQVLAEDETTDLETIKLVIAKKTRQTRYKDQEKMMAYLSRQGFRYNDIKEALKQSAEM